VKLNVDEEWLDFVAKWLEKAQGIAKAMSSISKVITAQKIIVIL